MLGRGVTIKGLAVTYITRRARGNTNADTMEQRARWFGYKRPYLDLCRIFLPEQLIEEYAELLNHEDDFWESLVRNERQGLSIRDWPRMLRLDTSRGLRPTRQSVASYRRFSGGGWEAQRRPIEDVEVAQRNIHVIRQFFEKRDIGSAKFGHVTHSAIRDCPLEDVIQSLMASMDASGTDWEKEYIIEYLTRLLLGQRLERIDVLLMAGDEEGFRKRDRKNETSIEPFQGPDTHRGPENPGYYPGDRNIHAGQPQLQVHLIRLKGETFAQPIETSALALYIPLGNPTYDLQFVVRSEEI